MIRNLIWTMMFFMLFFQLSLAETCPSIRDIKNGRLHAWQLYDSDNHKQLNVIHMTQFKKYAQQFTLAEWQENDIKHNTIRCYYRDLNGSEATAYLARNDFYPNSTNETWYVVSGSMHCAAGREQCSFQQKTSPPQLAKK
ncbi:MAG TPA: hypothetical protein VJN02_08650 [Gammaproteobacteria bacterium]|nr:hypothetical protein [Gammaproteobacteria bacterium]